MIAPSHSFIRTRSIFLSVAFIAGLLVETARGDFTGPYLLPDPGLFFVHNHTSPFAVGAWTATHQSTAAFPNPFIDTGVTGLVMFTDYAAADGFAYSEEIELTIKIVASGFLSFDYAIDRQAGPAISPDNDRAGYILNGIFTSLGSGPGAVENLAVADGDSFGFFVYAGPQCITCNPPWASGTEMTVTNFNAPVPEPSSRQLLFFGATCCALLKFLYANLTRNRTYRVVQSRRS